MSSATHFGLGAFAVFSVYFCVAHKFTVQSIDCQPIVECNEEMAGVAEELIRRNPYFPTVVASVVDYHGQIQTTFQTLWRAVTSIFLRLSYEREIFPLPDGGHIALDWISHKSKLRTSRGMKEGPDIQTLRDSQQTKLVIIFHGLCGDSTAEYIVHLADILLTEGYEVLVVVARGCGGLEIGEFGPGFLPHRKNESDIKYVLKHVRSLRPNSLLFGLGFSLGAAQLLKEIGKQDKQLCFSTNASVSCHSERRTDYVECQATVDVQSSIDLAAAVCISPPWDMERKTKVFHWWAPILTFALKIYALNNFKAIRRLGVSMWKVMFTRTVDEFDEHFIKIHGYGSVKEYRMDSSPVAYARYITTPTLAISAMDDPVCCVGGAPILREDKDSTKSDSSVEGKETSSLHNPTYIGKGLVIVKTKFGGHLGFPCVDKATIETPSNTHNSNKEIDSQSTQRKDLFTSSRYRSSLGSWLQKTWTDQVIVDWFNYFSNETLWQSDM